MAQHAFAKDYMERCTSVLGAQCVCKTGARHKHRGILFCTTDAVQKVKGSRLVVLVVTVVTVVVPRVAPALDCGRKKWAYTQQGKREREKKNKQEGKVIVVQHIHVNVIIQYAYAYPIVSVACP